MLLEPSYSRGDPLGVQAVPVHWKTFWYIFDVVAFQTEVDVEITDPS
jgi:hypothetical protein